MDIQLFEKDYCYDYLRWLQRLDNETLNGKTLQLPDFQNHILQTQDCAFAYFFAVEYGYQSHLMQKLILDQHDAKYACLFAQNIANCDVVALQKVVMSSSHLKYICKFACFVADADQTPLEKIIAQSNNAKYAYLYLKHVPSANPKKFKKVILNSKKPRYLFELAKHLQTAREIKQIEDLLIEAQSFTYLRMLAENIPLANLNKIEQAILASENIKEIKKFAAYVKGSRMKQFLIL
jgi:hypothetical protein